MFYQKSYNIISFSHRSSKGSQIFKWITFFKFNRLCNIKHNYFVLIFFRLICFIFSFIFFIFFIVIWLLRVLKLNSSMLLFLFYLLISSFIHLFETIVSNYVHNIFILINTKFSVLSSYKPVLTTIFWRRHSSLKMHIKPRHVIINILLHSFFTCVLINISSLNKWKLLWKPSIKSIISWRHFMCVTKVKLSWKFSILSWVFIPAFILKFFRNQVIIQINILNN